jgi:predicted phosphodiesterase
MTLESVIGAGQAAAIRDAGRLAFHCTGDTGGVKSPQPQQIVAMTMKRELASQPAPSFFFHLGDVIYYNGQKSEYYNQFYEPYTGYAVPIVGIPGNHDGDPLAPRTEPSLAGFVENFCASRPHLTPESEDSNRDAMTQPFVYWTLQAPFATIVGLYSNVPEGGQLDNDQVRWLHGEMQGAAADAALIVAVHHPAYSCDGFHGGSAYIGGVIDAAVQASGRTPDLVLTGHVHNYQRFTRTVGSRQVPYVVAGAGGYWNLHAMARDANGRPLPHGWTPPGSDVVLESYVDDRHGFLRLTVSPGQLTGQYVTVPRPQESWSNGPVTVADTFTVDLTNHTVTP